MGIIDDLLAHIELPRMIRVRQLFDSTSVSDIAAEIHNQLASFNATQPLRPGMRIALAVGSRGMNRLPELVSALVCELRRYGAEPFIVPAMGSHGGATAEGQLYVLEALGVTETSAGCPIISSMEVVEIDRLENGLPVLMDKAALQADGIVIINRIKPHTSFSGPIESGLVKMLSIGLGKQKGADSCHAMGFGSMAENIVTMAEIKIAKTPILFGVATIENAYDKICKIALLPAARIVEEEPALLAEARQAMPRILFNLLDVLVVDRMGKNYSGTGTDPNITGRAATPLVRAEQKINKMAILDLSEPSHGNATGVGLADICTRRLVDKINFDATYANHITSTELSHGKIPLTMNNDRLAIQLAVKTCNVLDPAQLRLVRIPNTLELGTIMISEGLLAEAQAHPQIEILGGSQGWEFDSEGNLKDL